MPPSSPGPIGEVPGLAVGSKPDGGAIIPPGPKPGPPPWPEGAKPGPPSSWPENPGAGEPGRAKSCPPGTGGTIPWSGTPWAGGAVVSASLGGGTSAVGDSVGSVVGCSNVTVSPPWLASAGVAPTFTPEGAVGATPN